MKPTLHFVTPLLGKTSLVKDCLSTHSADEDGAAKDSTKGDNIKSIPDIESRVMKSLNCKATGIEKTVSIFPIITAESGGVKVNMLLDRANETMLFTDDIDRRTAPPSFKVNKFSMQGVGDVRAGSSDTFANLKLTIGGKDV